MLSCRFYGDVDIKVVCQDWTVIIIKLKRKQDYHHSQSSITIPKWTILFNYILNIALVSMSIVVMSFDHVPPTLCSHWKPCFDKQKWLNQTHRRVPTLGLGYRDELNGWADTKSPTLSASVGMDGGGWSVKIIIIQNKSSSVIPFS